MLIRNYYKIGNSFGGTGCVSFFGVNTMVVYYIDKNNMS